MLTASVHNRDIFSVRKPNAFGDCGAQTLAAYALQAKDIQRNRDIFDILALAVGAVVINRDDSLKVHMQVCVLQFREERIKVLKCFVGGQYGRNCPGGDGVFHFRADRLIIHKLVHEMRRYLKEKITQTAMLTTLTKKAMKPPYDLTQPSSLV
jgi:hypothetical protein